MSAQLALGAAPALAPIPSLTGGFLKDALRAFLTVNALLARQGFRPRAA